MVPFKVKKHFGYMLKYISCKKKTQTINHLFLLF